jgi:hypothetical protein
MPRVSREYLQRFVQAGTLGLQQVRYYKTFPSTSMREVESDLAAPDPMKLRVFDGWPWINKDETYRISDTQVSCFLILDSRLTKVLVNSDI